MNDGRAINSIGYNIEPRVTSDIIKTCAINAGLKELLDGLDSKIELNHPANVQDLIYWLNEVILSKYKTIIWNVNTSQDKKVIDIQWCDSQRLELFSICGLDYTAQNNVKKSNKYVSYKWKYYK